MNTLSIIIAVVGCLVAVVTFFIGRQSASKAEGREAGQILSEIGYLKRGIDDIKSDFKDQCKSSDVLRDRVTVIERDLKTVFASLNEIKEELKNRSD